VTPGPPRALTRRSLAAGVERLAKADRDLARVVERHGLPPLWGRPPGFATLVQIVLEQQVSLASARTLARRLETHAGALSPAALARLGSEGLRAAGLTRQKASFCHGLACSVLEGRLDLGAIARLDDAAARQRLTALSGIGPWTAAIYQLMALRRPDVWPDGDLALARTATRLKSPSRPLGRDDLRAMAEGWRPWRAVAARILWHEYLSAERRRPRAAGPRGSGMLEHLPEES
jgi:DNA-3-methyladenine glycosylase II